jgi:hypothetical protein
MKIVAKILLGSRTINQPFTIEQVDGWPRIPRLNGSLAVGRLLDVLGMPVQQHAVTFVKDLRTLTNSACPW